MRKKQTIEEKCWKKLWANVNMSSKSGAAGMRIENNPKLSGRERKGNQSTKRHDIDINIDYLKKLWEDQDGKCFWLGIDMSLEDLLVSYSPFAPSVDRLDSKKGYLFDNVVLTTRFANKGRGAYDNEDFLPRLNDLFKNKYKK